MKKKKSKNKVNKHIYKLVIVFLLIIYFFSFINSNLFSGNDINDYYNYINEELFESEDIPEGEVGWSKFSKAQDVVDDRVDGIVLDLINSKKNSDLNVFYSNFIDMDERNNIGINPLKKYINLINSSKNINEFIDNAMVIENELFIDIFTLSTVNSDFKDSSKNIVYFYPITYDFGSSSDIYVDEEYSRYHALYKQYQIKLLKLYGYSKEEARSISKELDSFFIDIASSSKTSKDLSDVDSLYNVVSKNELQDIYSNIDIDKYLNKMGIGNEKYFSVVDIDNYKKMNSYLTNDNLGLLKNYVLVKILENYGGYASKEYADCINELNDKILGVTSSDTLEDQAISLINTYFSFEVDKVYIEKYFPTNSKSFIESMINDTLSFYKEHMSMIEWLSVETKEKAKLKLEKMKVNVGGSYTEYNYKLSNNSSLLDNVILMNKIISDNELVRLKEDKINFDFSATVVNAYYNPLDNSINFPAALKELYQTNGDYYAVLGSVGSIISHEITHAFDNNGAKFDEKGNRVDWWTEEDYKKFEEFQNDVFEYYSNFEVMDGIYVDGEKTVGENIADLGGFSLIVTMAREKGATEDEMKVLFSNYAMLWASEYTDSYQKLLVLSDTHSPDRIRVNAVVASIDYFYELYKIGTGCEMYIDQKRRVSFW